MSLKELRQRTQAGLLDCKKALEESNGDIEAAMQILKERGLAKAMKRAGNEANERAVVVGHEGDVYCMICFASETDFVLKNEDFCLFVNSQLADFMSQNVEEPSLCIGFNEKLSAMISKLGENIVLKDFCKINVANSGKKIVQYVHSKFNSQFPNIGKVGVQLVMNASADEQLAQNLAMHAAAFKPVYLHASEFDPSKHVSSSEIKHVVMENQPFLLDSSMSVKQICEKNDVVIDSMNVFC